MKKVALITDGCVSNLARVKDDEPIPEGWIAAADDARIDDLYDGQTFTTPAAPAVPLVPLEEAKAEAMATVYATHASYLRQATDNATREERDTWPVKTAAATAYLANTATAGQTAFIEAEATRGGVTPTEMAQTITTKDAEYLDHIRQGAALCDSGCAAVEAATTHDALQAALEAFSSEAQVAFDALAAN